jgi:hypothetical protein
MTDDVSEERPTPGEDTVAAMQRWAQHKAIEAAEERAAQERAHLPVERVRAMVRLLINSGDATPYAAHLLEKIIREESPEPPSPPAGE